MPGILSQMKKKGKRYETLCLICQKVSGITIKIEISKKPCMLGPVAFILGGIATLVSLWAYVEKVLGI